MFFFNNQVRIVAARKVSRCIRWPQGWEVGMALDTVTYSESKVSQEYRPTKKKHSNKEINHKMNITNETM